jgi:hypothetical protein
VFAYNFSVNDAFNWGSGSVPMLASNPMHSTSTDYILEEGNIGAGVNVDAVHGPHFLDTFVRNDFSGYEANQGSMPSYGTTPFGISAFSRYNNLVGNVAGTSGYHTVYECIPNAATQKFCTAIGAPAETSVYNVGWSHLDQLDYNNTPGEPNDITTATTLMRWGNYDVVNGSAQFNSSEVPTNDPNYPNSVPSSHTISPSFYNGVYSAHSSCGTGLNFWKNPTTGTCPEYPPIGPDVTSGDIGMCTSGAYNWSRALTSNQCAGGAFTTSINDGYGNSNPAMRCYLNQMSGPPDGTGKFLSFSRASCYANDASSDPPPAAPTGLSATVTP